MTEAQVARKTLREWRQEAGLNQRELAELAGIKRATMSHLEIGLVNITSPAGQKVLDALQVHAGQVLPDNTWKSALQARQAQWADDGFSPTAPVKPLDWWRCYRSLSISELAVLTGIARANLQSMMYGRQNGVTPKTRAALAGALKVAPDKLILPGDDAVPTDKQSVESLLRAELRGARRALRRSYDFLRDDSNISLRNLEKRDALLPEIERELKGT